MCPIPTCKRYSPQVSGTGDVAELPVVDAPLSEVVSTSRQRAEMLGSGVAYYPPQQSAPPAYTAETSIHSDTSHFLDVTVEKVKVLVLREMGLDVGPALRGLREAVRMDEEDPDMPQSRHSPFSQDLLRLEPVQPDPLGSPRIEPETKRRRNHLHSPRSRSRTPSSSAASVYDWPFKKDLMATLECDVCAMLLYEPVTTPCQHVYPSFEPRYGADVLCLVFLLKVLVSVPRSLVPLPRLQAGFTELCILSRPRGEQGPSQYQ